MRQETRSVSRASNSVLFAPSQALNKDKCDAVLSIVLQGRVRGGGCVSMLIRNLDWWMASGNIDPPVSLTSERRTDVRIGLDAMSRWNMSAYAYGLPRSDNTSRTRIWWWGLFSSVEDLCSTYILFEGSEISFCVCVVHWGWEATYWIHRLKEKARREKTRWKLEMRHKCLLINPGTKCKTHPYKRHFIEGLGEV